MDHLVWPAVLAGRPMHAVPVQRGGLVDTVGDVHGHFVPESCAQRRREETAVQPPRVGRLSVQERCVSGLELKVERDRRGRV